MLGRNPCQGAKGMEFLDPNGNHCRLIGFSTGNLVFPFPFLRVLASWRDRHFCFRPVQAKSYTITFTQTFLKTVSTNSTWSGWIWYTSWASLSVNTRLRAIW